MRAITPGLVDEVWRGKGAPVAVRPPLAASTLAFQFGGGPNEVPLGRKATVIHPLRGILIFLGSPLAVLPLTLACTTAGLPSHFSPLRHVFGAMPMLVADSDRPG